MKKRQTAGSLAHLQLIDDRTAVFGFLAFLVVVIFLFDSFSDQQSLFGSRTTQATTTNTAGASPQLTKEQADQVVSKLVIDTPQRDDVAFIVKDTVDPQLLEYFTSMDYEQIKKHLGIQSDFAMHFEDQDGRVIPMGNKLCVGSKEAMLNGVPCG